MKDIIQQSLRESQDVLAQFLSDPSKLDAIEKAANCLVDALQQGKKFSLVEMGAAIVMRCILRRNYRVDIGKTGLL